MKPFNPGNLGNQFRSFLRQSRLARIGLWFFGAFALFGLFGFLAGPPIAKSILVDKLSQALHRQVSIEKISINPYALSAHVRNLSARNKEGQEVAGFDSLDINLEASSLFRGGPVISELALNGPRLQVTRLEDSRYDISDLIDEWSKPSDNKKPARFAVYNIKIDNGKLVLIDRPTGATHKVTDLKLQLPFISNLPYQTDIHVQPHFSAVINGSPLALEGRSKPFDPSRESELSLDLDRVDLVKYAAYSPVKLPFTLKKAMLDTELKLLFRQSGNEAGMLKLTGGLHLRDVALSENDSSPLLEWKRLDIGLDQVDLLQQKLALGQIRLTGLEQNLRVDAQGQLNWIGFASRLQGNAVSEKKAAPDKPFQIAVREVIVEEAGWTWQDTAGGKRPTPTRNPQQLRLKEARLKGIELDSASKQLKLAEISLQGADASLKRDAYGLIDLPQAGKAPPDSSKSWEIAIGRIDLAGSKLRYEEQGQKETRLQQVDDLQLSLEDFSTAPGKPAKLSLSAKVNQKGSIKLAGNIQAQPLNTRLDIDMEGLPIMPVQPLFSDKLSITLLRGQISGKGSLNLTDDKGNINGSYKGQLQVGDFHSIDKVNSADFLRWKSLAIDKIEAQLQPMAFNVGDVALDDFYARMIVTPEGKLNLSQILRQPEGTKTTAGEPVKEAEGRAQVTLGTTDAAKKVPPVRIAKVSFRNGRVNFSDQFVKPNYSANVTKIRGSLRGLSSAAGTLADLELHGSYGNAAPVDITAKLNPLAAKTYLDLKGEVRGVDLTTLSTYSGKYAGYAIEKGKLSLYVTYKLENNQLSAENRVFLDQLTFGEKVESPDATSLPVKLAVALLKNNRGEIDINLPISGSLDDPQFSLGGVVVQVIVNTFVKVVTSPFALLGSLFGGGEELSRIEFAPGQSRLSPEAIKKLEAMAKAMNDRPALKLEITGRADPQADIEGAKRAAIDRAVRAEKQKEQVKKGAETVSLHQIEVDAKEYPDYLRRVYKAAKFKKPTNLIGMDKSLPVEEMEKLLIANTEVSEDDLRQLASRRAQVVQAWLVGEGKVPMERVFLMAPKLNKEESSNDKEKSEGKISASRVDFSLR